MKHIANRPVENRPYRLVYRIKRQSLTWLEETLGYLPNVPELTLPIRMMFDDVYDYEAYYN